MGWDQAETRTFNGICRHTALAALAQLRATAIRSALTGNIQLPDPDSVPASHTTPDSLISDADLIIPLGDAPLPDHGGKPCPPGIAAIKLSIAETTRLAQLATQYTTRLISRAHLAFALRWSQTTPTPPGHRPLAPLQHPTPRRDRNRIASHNRKEVTQCSHARRQPITLSGSATTHRKTATVVRAGASHRHPSPRTRSRPILAGYVRAGQPAGWTATQHDMVTLIGQGSTADRFVHPPQTTSRPSACSVSSLMCLTSSAESP
jgi:hypothetical protein